MLCVARGYRHDTGTTPAQAWPVVPVCRPACVARGISYHRQGRQVRATALLGGKYSAGCRDNGLLSCLCDTIMITARVPETFTRKY
jgi:hypothetical protein